jgi:site-specific DNA-methyltransferase (adenine-specific)
MQPYYQDDLVTIYHGDCREWMPEADVIVTDPPYGIGWTGTTDSKRHAVVRRAFAIAGDDEPFDPAMILALGKPTVLFGANHYASRLPDSPSWLVWDKRPTGQVDSYSDGEMAWSNLGGPLRIHRQLWVGGGSLGQENGIAAGQGRPVGLHPTQKPLSLMRWVIGRCPEGTILDPFMGSGSTLVAAKSLNRRAIGIEIEERYCEIAAQRCSQEVLGLAV